MKTSELAGDMLNLIVAKLEGHKSRCPWMLEKEGYTAWQSYETAWGNPIPDYATDPWFFTGLIQRHFITLLAPDNHHWGTWRALTGAGYDKPTEYHAKTPMLAALRCYVASKLGDEVDVLKELTCNPGKST